LLPGTDGTGASHMAERLRGEVETLSIPHFRSSVADHVTISIGGVATVPPEGSLPDGFLAAADRMLYQAKREGRNRMCFTDQLL
jgi:diguanylate cyclase (GGDEF)-like protein